MRTRALGTVAVLASGLLLASSISAGAGGACVEYRSAERKMARKINAARGKAGVSALQLDPQLTVVARRHTRRMIEERDVFHTPSSRLSKVVTNWVMLGENVGEGGSIWSLHRRFMSSPAHRANIVGSSYRYIGVGAKWAKGRLWVTIVFEAQKDPGTTLTMPTCTATG